MSNRIWEEPGTLEHAKRQALIAALQASNFKMAEAARQLRVGRSTLYRLCEIYEMDAIDRSHVET
jgi:transcriptional regulator of acetoin/glycerol metabolism